MWDQSLKEIDHEEVIEQAKKIWALHSSCSSILVNDGINLVYRIDTPFKSLFLKISPYNEQIFKNLSNSLELQNYLLKRNVYVAQPILSLNGLYLEKICQQEVSYLLCLTEGVPGNKMNFNYEDLKHYKHWGRSLAELHQELQKITPYKKSHFKSWQDSWMEIETYIEKESPEIREKYEEIQTWLKSSDFEEQSLGLVHGDHQCQNVFYNEKDIYFIDFDEVTYHFYGLDIIMSFLELFGTPYKNWEYKFKAFLEGYQLVLPTNLKSLYYLAQMKSLEIYLNCKNKWTLPTGPGGQDKDLWIDNLKKMVMNPLLLKKI